MITASEPLEFIPRGQAVVEQIHPGRRPNEQTDNFWLHHRLGNISLNHDQAESEFWQIRDKFETLSGQFPLHSDILRPVYSNSEDELYVRGQTAIWSRGISLDSVSVPFKSFSIGEPIKFAFFCPSHFIRTDPNFRRFDKANEQKSSFSASGAEQKSHGICIVDSTSVKTYLDNGEDFITSLEFQVADVWPCLSCVLFEKDASTTTIEARSIAMPRLFSITHPLEEMCPVLLKYIDYLGYFSNCDHHIIFCGESSHLVLLYDMKSGHHFLTRLRRVTADEINFVGESTEQNSEFFGNVSATSQLVPPGASFLHQQSHRNATKLLHTSHAPWNMGKHTLSTSGVQCTPQANRSSSRILSPLVASKLQSNQPLIRATQSPLARLQSSIRHTSFSMLEARDYGQAEPPKPIYPEFCLDTIWIEETTQVDGPSEPASKGFYHTDWVGQRYLCYLLPRKGKLNLIAIGRQGRPSGEINSIDLKEAINLERMSLIVGLDHCGALVLYSGPVFVGKVHISGVLFNLATVESFNNSGQFPKRSSLLPTASQESEFDEDLHLLSPVTPVLNYQKSIFHSKSSGHCVGLRDPTGNRFTLVCQNGKMYRITLPDVCESVLVSRFLLMLRSILPAHLARQLLSKWYGTRNVPGALDLSQQAEWKLFQNMLSELIGRPVLEDADLRTTSKSDEPKRRKREEDSSSATDADWEFLLAITGSPIVSQKTEPAIRIPPRDYNASAILYAKVPLLFFSMHLLYEDLKLDCTYTGALPLIAKFLYKLSVDLRLSSYGEHYILDEPKLLHIHSEDISPLSDNDMLKLENFHTFLGPQREVPNIFRHIDHILAGTLPVQKYPYMSDVNLLSCRVIKFIQKNYNAAGKLSVEKLLDGQSRCDEAMDTGDARPRKTNCPAGSYSNLTGDKIRRLPYAIKMIYKLVFEKDREKPPLNLAGPAYELMMRPDLVSHSKFTDPRFVPNEGEMGEETSLSLRAGQGSPDHESSSEIDDGMSNVDTQLLRLRFPVDLRVQEVRRLLDSASPALIDIVQGPGVTDHDFIEEKEKQLFSLCTRTMALAVGRGMFTLRAAGQMPGNAMHIPKLCLTGKEVTKGAVVELSQAEVLANMNAWPLFHNGVAAGLKISPDQKDVDSTWIVYNKPKMDVSPEHSGFLMALGLNGHLKSLSFMGIYDYLVRCDEMTSIGLLLGISAAHRGTQDAAMTKVLSVHIEALLPPTALELEIQQNVQIAAIMGIGLLYQGTAKRHIAEVLLQEIGRPPGPEMENCVERESYALTAGLALGLVTLGLGETPTALQDLHLADTLHYYMVGGNKRPIVGAQKEKYKLQSFQIREGDTVNIDVTGPGATLCLGLMFFRTENLAVANWMLPPDTKYLLDFVRPDLLLLRTIARGLILWKEVEPTMAWLDLQIPEILKFDLKRGPPVDETKFVDDEAFCQAYCNIITGASFAIALKYAGTADPRAFKTLRKVFDTFLAMGGQFIGEYAGKETVESCLMLIVLSLSLVFAGSGSLEVVRIVRAMRSRIGPQNSHVTYGSHMALHMALGFLFLGAGRFTLSRSPSAIAALLCALFPKFPIHSNDNRYHLQAFRHLYVLAVEARLFLPRDISTGRLTLCQLTCVQLDSDIVHNLPAAPCMLPELDLLRRVTVNDPQFWPVTFELDKNWEQLKCILAGSHCVDLKRRAGCVKSFPDRMGTKAARAWHIKDKVINDLGSDFAASFSKAFLMCGAAEKPTSSELANQFYDCLRLDSLSSFAVMIAHFENVRARTSKAGQMWQLKIMHTLCDRQRLPESTSEVLRSMQLRLDIDLESILEGRDDVKRALQCLIGSTMTDSLKCLNAIEGPNLDYVLFLYQYWALERQAVEANPLLFQSGIWEHFQNTFNSQE